MNTDKFGDLMLMCLQLACVVVVFVGAYVAVLLAIHVTQAVFT